MTCPLCRQLYYNIDCGDALLPVKYYKKLRLNVVKNTISVVFDFAINLEIACVLKRKRRENEFWKREYQTRARKQIIVWNIRTAKSYIQLYKTVINYRHFMSREEKLRILSNNARHFYYIWKPFIMSTIQVMLERSFNKGLSTEDEICNEILTEVNSRDSRLIEYCEEIIDEIYEWQWPYRHHLDIVDIV